MSQQFLKSLNWRRALKHFLPSDNRLDITPVLEAARLAPTSNGVQPFHIHVVSSQSTRIRIAPAVFNQNQVMECAHLLIFTARDDAPATVERYIARHSIEKSSPDYANSLRATLSTMDRRKFLEFSSNQAHIALGFALAAAADLRMGSCPMGGFNPVDLKEKLQLPANEFPVVLMAIGTAPSEDAEVNAFPKLRFNLNEIVRYFPE